MNKTITITDEAKLSTSEMFETFKKKFKGWSYWDDIDLTFPKPEKPTTRSFAMQEDPDLTNVSYDDLKEQGKEFMTLREYLIFFEKYYDETGKYPDEKGWIVFSDALPDGGVACGNWRASGGRVGFYWNCSGRCDPDVGARLAIPSPSTFPPSSLRQKLEKYKKKDCDIGIFTKSAEYQLGELRGWNSALELVAEKEGELLGDKE